MTTRLHWLTGALCLISILCTVTSKYVTEDYSSPAEKEVTFSHVYKIDLAKSPECKLALQTLPSQQDQFSGLQELEGGTTLEGENNIVFRHQINLKTPKCDCDESESFTSLLYRVNGLEEEVEHLKSQCSQGCCGGKGGGAGGVDTSCSGHGTYQHNTCSCQCNPSWEGPDCSISTCPDECNDNGRCVDGKCVCHAGYTGSDCSQLMCPGDCNDKGHCVDGKCVCHAGYTGSDCSQLMCPGDCNDKGHCVDGKCVCHAGYTGSDCSQLMCPGDCNDKGHCVDGKCVCHAGYTGSDCSQLMCPGDCNDKGHCVDGKCVCHAGYTGSDCSQLMCPGDCNDKGHCVDGKCVCHAGYTGSDCSQLMCPGDCNDKGHCVDGKCVCHAGYTGSDCSQLMCPGDCNDKGHCVDGKCVCHAGYTGSDCSQLMCPGDCNDNGRCVDGKCVCHAGYTGSDCSQLMCPGDCNDKGHCVDGKCVCHAGYTGSDCSQLMCPGDCNDKGHCVDGKCVCHAGYTGSDCSQLMCPGDCNDKGHCVDGKCVCHAGYTGSDCSQLMCPGDCNDNGRCVDGKCVCHAGYTGSDCSQLMCPGDCNDKGHCVDGKCVCFSHFTGEDCSQQNCDPDCIHGSCVNGMCICDEGFFGEDCSTVSGPNGLRLVRVTDNSLLVEWEAVKAAEYYILTWHPEGNEAELERFTVPNTETSYLITGLSPGVSYIVQVYAVIKEIQSEGDRIEATTEVSGIDGIRVLGQTEDSIQVDWQNPAAPLDHFRLTYANPDGQEEEQNVPMSAEARTTHTIVGLHPGTEYLITVQGIKGTIEGKASFATGVTDLDDPTNLLTKEVTEDTATVEWQKIQAEIDGYLISYSSAEGSSGEIPVGADSTSYRLTGLRPGVLYTVYIWAVKGSRVSRKSSTEAETELDVPTNLLTREVTEDTATVTWDKVQAEIDGYLISYSSAEGSSGEIPVGADSTSYRLTGLRPGVLYTVYIWAVKGSRVSRKSSTEAETELDVPTNLLTREVTEDTATVTWDKVQAEIDGYLISYSSAEGSSGEIPVGADSTSYRLTGLRPGVLYTVYIWAVKGSRVSRKSFIDAETDLDAPTNLFTREVTEDTADVSWDRPLADIDGYLISYSSAEGSSGEIPVGADSTSYRLTGLRPGVIYTVYIWAVKGFRVSRKSSTEAETEIDAPKNLKASDVKLNVANLTWTAPLARIDGYILTLRAEDGSLKAVEKTLRAGESSFAMSGLEKGKNYIVTLLAYRGPKRSRVIEITFKTVGLLYPFPMDCTQIKKNGNVASGIYTIYVNSDRTKPMEVYCDMDTDGGGWVVFQRRNNGQMDFMKRWRQYMAGFGNMTDEFWLGLDNIYELTNTPTQYELRVDLGVGSEKAYAVYDNFKIAPAKQKFKLTIGEYSGTAGDAMSYHQGHPFSTVDNDNDISLGNCALIHRGAWWYKNCHLANLNGKFGDNRHSMGVNWEPWKGHLMSLDFTEMKIRPVGTARKRRSLRSSTAPRK